jgi:hypothetical protein
MKGSISPIPKAALCYQPPVRNRPRSRRFSSATRSCSTFRDYAWATPGWDDTKVVRPDGCGQARGGWKRGSSPLAGERCPPSKTRTPPSPPGFSPPHFHPGMVKGRAAIEALWKNMAEQVSDPKLTTLDVKPLGPSAAREIGTFSIKTKGPMPREVTGKYVVVWEKIGSDWKLAADIWNDGK